MTPSPAPSLDHPAADRNQDLSQPPSELTQHERQTTRILMNTYGSGCILGVLHSDTGLTDAAWAQLVGTVEDLWANLGLASPTDQEEVTRADREAFFAETNYPADIRAKIEEAWDNEDRLAIIEIVAFHGNLDVSVAGWSSWGVSTVYF